MPEVRPVTIDNWQALIALDVREDQRRFVASNVKSIAEAQFGFDEPGDGHWDFFPHGIFDDDAPVGFLMYGFNFNHPLQQAFIIRLMVDARHQGRGYGRFALQWMIDLFSQDARIQTVGIGYEEENAVARKFYAAHGFVETGELSHDEVLARLKLR